MTDAPDADAADETLAHSADRARGILTPSDREFLLGPSPNPGIDVAVPSRTAVGVAALSRVHGCVRVRVNDMLELPVKRCGSERRTGVVAGRGVSGGYTVSVMGYGSESVPPNGSGYSPSEGRSNRV